MTDREQALLVAMFKAHDELRRLGWQDAVYAPKGPILDLIEPGSTGIHRGHRDEEGRFWVTNSMDTWPSKPSLFRLPPN